jgi:hypothetical protein
MFNKKNPHTPSLLYRSCGFFGEAPRIQVGNSVLGGLGMKKPDSVLTKTSEFLHSEYVNYSPQPIYFEKKLKSSH